METNNAKLITMPVGHTEEDSVPYLAVVIYGTKTGYWAVTKLSSTYWKRYNIKPSKRYSSLTYVVPGHTKYGRTTPIYKSVYYKGIPVSKKRLTQKELIAMCKQFNKDKVTYESLAAMGREERMKLFGQL